MIVQMSNSKFYEGDIEMKKTYMIDVDCANCANKMEQARRRPKASRTPL